MNTVIIVLDAIFVLLLIAGIAMLLIDFKKHKEETKIAMKVGGWKKTVKTIVVLNTTCFFDVLGIGAYAPSTAAFKLLKMTRDVMIPGTLLVSMLVYTQIVSIYSLSTFECDLTTTVLCIAAAGIGAYVGGGIFAKFNLTKMRLALGIALSVVAVVLALNTLGYLDFGGTELGVTGWKLAVITIFSFIMGALMSIGIGCYAPTLAMVSLLGMDPHVSWPIMIGMCGVLCPIAAIRYIKESLDSPVAKYDRKITIVGNLCTWAPLISMFLVQSMPLDVLKALVICIVIYVAVTMLWQATHVNVDRVAEAEDAEAAALEGRT